MPQKVNRSRSLAKKGMRKKGQTQFRPEQQLAYDIIKLCGFNGLKMIEMEYKPTNILPLEGTDLTGKKSPIIDIYMRSIDGDFEHFAIRLNGPYHDELKVTRKDFIQKTFLEMQPEKWRVIDFGYINMQTLFKRNVRKLSPGELIFAYNEVKKNLLPFGINLKTPSDETLKKLAFLHCD